jgi:tetrahydromethanopterin S-methyltransferase subunit E
MTHDITLPYRKKPRFPHRCVVCDATNPDAIAELKIVIAIQHQGVAADIVDAIFSSSSKASDNVTITLNPCVCRQCQQSLEQYHFWKRIWQYLGPVLGVALFVLSIAINLTYIGIGALIAGIVLPVIYELVFPAAVSATGSGRNVSYEFRSQLCAQEFAQLNQDRNHSSNPEP